MGFMKLTLDEYRMEYRPGETIRGTAEWRLERSAGELEIRLYWYTSGKGTEDNEVVDTDRLSPVPASGSRKFAFELPEGPYSFSGQLISLNWGIEMVVDPGGDSERVAPVIVSPTRKEIVLTSHESPPESV